MKEHIYKKKTLLDLMKEKRIKARDLAEKLDISVNTVYDYNTGKYLPPLDIYWKLSKILEIPLDDLRDILSTE